MYVLKTNKQIHKQNTQHSKQLRMQINKMCKMFTIQKQYQNIKVFKKLKLF